MSTHDRSSRIDEKRSVRRAEALKQTLKSLKFRVQQVSWEIFNISDKLNKLTQRIECSGAHCKW